jgi:hypothetical protein
VRIVTFAIVILIMLYQPEITDAFPDAIIALGPTSTTGKPGMTTCIPEPGTVILLGLGLLIVGLFIVFQRK